jgi:hypothetical protein
MSSLSTSSKFSNTAASTSGPAAAIGARSGAREGASSQADQSAEFMQSPEMGMISSLIQALTQSPPRDDSPQDAPQGKLQAAAAEIAKDEAGRGTLDSKQMTNLANGKSADGLGTDSAEEQQAAAYIMGGQKGDSGESKRWEKIETADVAGADGLSSLANFSNVAAQGGKPAGGSNDDELLKLMAQIQAQEPLLRSLSRGVVGAGADAANSMAQSLQQLVAQEAQTLKSLLKSDD